MSSPKLPKPARSKKSLPPSAQPHAPIYVSTSVPKPSDEKAWEKAMTEVARRKYNDPKARRYGRSGQKQHGFDIRGRINCDANRIFVIQCKQTGKPTLKPGTLQNEYDAAKQHHKKLEEFVLATTAPRSQKLQDELLALQQRQATTGDKTEVDIWFWDDIEEFCESDPELRRVFDPTYSTHTDVILLTQEVIREGQQSQARQLSRMEAVLTEVRTETLSRTKDLTDQGRRDTENHGRITAAIDLINDGQVAIVQAMLGNLAELDLTTEENFRLIEANAALLYRTGNGEEAATVLEDLFDLPVYEELKPYKRAMQATLREDWSEAARLAEEAIEQGNDDVKPAQLLVQARANLNTDCDPISGIAEKHKDDPSIRVARAFWLRRNDDLSWYEEARRLVASHPDDELVRVLAAEAVLEEKAGLGGYYAQGAASVSDLKEAATALADVAEARFDRGVWVDWSTVTNAVTSLRAAGEDERCRTLLDKALTIAPQDTDLLLQGIFLECDSGDPQQYLDRVKDDDAHPAIAFFRMQVLLKERRYEELEAALSRAIQSGDLLGHATMFHTIRSRFRYEREGLEAALASLDNDPELDPVARFTMRGELFARAGENDAARAEVDAACQAADDETPLPILMDIALLALSVGGTRAVTAVLDGKLNLQHPEPAALWLSLCEHGGERRRFANAVALMPQDVLADPTIQIKQFEMALTTGDPNAVSYGLAVEKSQPRSLAVLTNLLMVLDARGERKKVRARLAALSFDDYDWHLHPALILARRAFHHGLYSQCIALAYDALCRSWGNVEAHDTYQALFFAATKEEADDIDLDVTTFGPDTAIILRDDKGNLRSHIHPQTNRHPVLSDKLPLHGDDLAHFEQAKIGDKLAIASGPKAEQFTVAEIKHVYVDVLHRSMARSKTEFGDRAGNKSVEVAGNDIKPIIDLVRETEARKQARLDEALAIYRKEPYPVSTFGRFLRIDAIFAFHTLIGSGGKFFSADGFAKSLDEAIKGLVTPPDAVVVDPLTAYFLVRGDHLETVQSVIGRLLTTQSVLDVFEARRAELMFAADGDDFSLFVQDGEIFRRDNDAEAIAREKERREADIKSVRNGFEIVPAIPNDDLLTSHKAHPEVIGHPEWDCILAASGLGVPLLSDDLRLRWIARSVAEVESFWVHPVMKRANENGLLSDRDLSNYVAGSIEAGFDSVAFSGDDLLQQVLSIEDGQVSAPVKKMLQVAGGPMADLPNNISITVRMIKRLQNSGADELFSLRVFSAALYAFCSSRWEAMNDICQAYASLLGRGDRAIEHIYNWQRWHRVGFRESDRNP